MFDGASFVVNGDGGLAVQMRDWEEQEVMAAGKARRALALALTGMIRDGEISRERALELARRVMRENAIRLYGLAPAASQ